MYLGLWTPGCPHGLCFLFLTRAHLQDLGQTNTCPLRVGRALVGASPYWPLISLYIYVDLYALVREWACSPFLGSVLPGRSLVCHIILTSPVLGPCGAETTRVGEGWFGKEVRARMCSLLSVFPFDYVLRLYEDSLSADGAT